MQSDAMHCMQRIVLHYTVLYGIRYDTMPYDATLCNAITSLIKGSLIPENVGKTMELFNSVGNRLVH